MSNPDPFALQSAPLPRPKKIKGLGDVAHWIAKPIAALSDRVIGTDLANCSSCEKRRREWNEKFAFVASEEKITFPQEKD